MVILQLLSYPIHSHFVYPSITIYHCRYLASLLCLIAIQNVLAQEGKYEYRFPDAQIADYLTIDAQDSLVVEWIRNGSIESTELGIKCWARSANPELRASSPLSCIPNLTSPSDYFFPIQNPRLLSQCSTKPSPRLTPPVLTNRCMITKPSIHPTSLLKFPSMPSITLASSPSRTVLRRITRKPVSISTSAMLRSARDLALHITRGYLRSPIPLLRMRHHHRPVPVTLVC